jgi:hypothetical protein
VKAPSTAKVRLKLESLEKAGEIKGKQQICVDLSTLKKEIATPFLAQALSTLCRCVRKGISSLHLQPSPRFLKEAQMPGKSDQDPISYFHSKKHLAARSLETLLFSSQSSPPMSLRGFCSASMLVILVKSTSP